MSDELELLELELEAALFEQAQAEAGFRTCPSCGKKFDPYNRGGGKRLSESPRCPPCRDAYLAELKVATQARMLCGSLRMVRQYYPGTLPDVPNCGCCAGCLRAAAKEQAKETPDNAT